MGLFRKKSKPKLDIYGTWDYECRIPPEYRPDIFHFPKEENMNAHGGQCTIYPINISKNVVNIEIKGVRLWNGVILQDGKIDRKNNLKKDWNSRNGCFVGDKKIFYDYFITDEPLIGLTEAEIICDNQNRPLSIQGEFHYKPHKDLKNIDLLDRMISIDYIKQFTPIVGTVLLENFRKK